MESAIEFTNVKKRYGTLAALRGVSFSVGRGEMFGLIGPDGAGKTTAIRQLRSSACHEGRFACRQGPVKDHRRLRTSVTFDVQFVWRLERDDKIASSPRSTRQRLRGTPRSCSTDALTRCGRLAITVCCMKQNSRWPHRVHERR